MNNQKDFSFTKGYSFIFEDDGKKIEAWFSALSGLEKVYVDGELVSVRRNLSTNSTNVFTIGSNEYSTNMKVVSFFKGPFVCTLNKNGSEYKRQKLVFPRVKRHSTPIRIFVNLLFFVVLGGLFGFARSYCQLPKESDYIFIVAIFFTVFLYNFRSYKGSTPIIEDEEIV